MTAEIVIMNKEAIAIAADSAVTFPQEKGHKIFPSANKIFTLSKYHPVAIMIFGNAYFMEVPWETIIKTYRKLLGDNEYETLELYAESFLKFLCSEGILFPEIKKEQFFMECVYSFFQAINENIKKEVKLIIDEKQNITLREISKIISKVIKYYHDIWKKADYPLSIIEKHNKEFKVKYDSLINKAKAIIFENLPINKLYSNQLTETAINFFLKYLVASKDPVVSGVVIAGFGKIDIFPTVKSFYIEGVCNNILKYKEDKYRKITFDINASIVPFARTEMVATFMEGIDPYYELEIEKELSQILNDFPKIIIDGIDKLDNNEKSELKNKLNNISNDTLERYRIKFKDYKWGKYIDPVIKVVGMLPKADLAAMAESLVSLTSFKTKVSMVAETVGGPIDVALISKGDGFIWIKRKHYFSADLNAQFFSNYYRGLIDEKDNQK